MSKLDIRLYDSEHSSLIYRVLDRAGIEDKDLFLSQPNINSFKTDDTIKDLDKAMKNLTDFIEKGCNFGILIDPDVDGFTSSALFVLFLEKYNRFLTNNDTNICIKPFFHTKHGISSKTLLNEVISSEVDVLILPDSSSNDFKEQEILFENGINTIIIDHHLIENENQIPETSIIINNQRSGQTINKNLTGVGMVLKFIYYIYKQHNKEEEFFNEVEFFNLASVGQIADVSDISDLEIRFIVEKGLLKIENKLFHTILKDTHNHILESKYDKLAPIDISFSINPLINAVARIGDKDEMALIFDALVSTKEDKIYPITRKRKNRKSGKMEDTVLYWTKQDIAYDYLKKIKRRQDTVSNNLRDKVLHNLNTYGGVVVGILEETSQEENAVLGLAANKIANNLQKPTILLRKNDNSWTGSGRNYKDTFESFKNWCTESGLFHFAQGHDSAFGVGAEEDNLEKIVALASDIKPKYDESVYYVDVLEKEVNANKVLDGYLSRWITGGKVDDILFGYKDIRINKNFIKQMKTVTKIWEQNVEFIFFNDNGKIYNQLKETEGNSVRVDIVGEPRLNNWFSKQQLQIIVQDIAIRE